MNEREPIKKRKRVPRRRKVRPPNLALNEFFAVGSLIALVDQIHADLHKTPFLTPEEIERRITLLWEGLQEWKRLREPQQQPDAPTARVSNSRKRKGRPRGTVKPLYATAYKLKIAGSTWPEIFKALKIPRPVHKKIKNAFRSYQKYPQS